jgi:uncharacterized phage protein (TIGR01671 family)
MRERKIRAWVHGSGKNRMIQWDEIDAIEYCNDKLWYKNGQYVLLGNVYIMDYVGLQDKNKKDIYEGDIGEIRTKGGRIERFRVEWGIHRREMASGWTVDIPGYCFKIGGFPSFPIVENYLNGHDLDIIEIVGNIYQNPDNTI